MLLISLGLAHANPQDPGIWYLSGSPYKLHQNTITEAIGIEGKYWKAGVQNLGKTETDAYIPDHGYFHTQGKEYGVYAEGVYKFNKLISADAGIWVYRSSVYTNAGPGGTNAIFSSAAYGLGPVMGLSFGPVSFTFRLAENRSLDWNNHHQPSPTKGFVSTVQVKFDVKL